MEGGFRRMADQVAAILQERIIDGTMPPGSKVDIEAICADLGISRTPVREAILQLEGLGLVERQPYRGAIVVGVDLERYEEVTALRVQVEGMAAGLGAARISDADIDEMRSILDQIESRGTDADFALGTFNELNHRFHAILTRASGAPMLIRIVEMLSAEADRMRLHAKFDHTFSAGQHRAILAACEQRDAAAARDLMREHILAAYLLAGERPGDSSLLSAVIAETGIEPEKVIE